MTCHGCEHPPHEGNCSGDDCECAWLMFAAGTAIGFGLGWLACARAAR